MTTEEHAFVQCALNDWRQLTYVADRIGDMWFFRGQRDATWPLETTLYRAGLTYSHPELPLNLQIGMSEQAMLDLFKRQAFNYLPNPPAWDDTVEWLALIQHHGGPTRLLDFTKSLYVASFFALENAEDKAEAAVWALNPSLLRQDSFRLVEHGHGITPLALLELVRGDARESANQCIARSFTDEAPGVLVIHPAHQTDRMTIQQGVFLFPTTLTYPFEACLSKTLALRVPDLSNLPSQSFDDLQHSPWTQKEIVKLLIPWHVRVEFMRHLRMMNITAATLFPGIDGLARSLFSEVRYWEHQKLLAYLTTLSRETT